MGKRGPAPTPTKILEARVSWRAKERTAEPEVTAPMIESPPAWLTNEDALECWNHYRPLLGWLRATDRNIFTRYCEMWGIYRERCAERAAAVAREQKESLDARCAKLAEILLRIEAQIGLTPSARTGIKVDEKPRNNNKIRLLQGKKRASGSNA